MEFLCFRLFCVLYGCARMREKDSLLFVSWSIHNTHTPHFYCSPSNIVDEKIFKYFDKCDLINIISIVFWHFDWTNTHNPLCSLFGCEFLISWTKACKSFVFPKNISIVSTFEKLYQLLLHVTRVSSSFIVLHTLLRYFLHFEKNLFNQFVINVIQAWII